MFYDPKWSVITSVGPDCVEVCHNLFTNSVGEEPCYGAFLNEKGRLVTDAFIVQGTQPHTLLIVVPSSRLEICLEHINSHGIFSDVHCSRSPLRVYRSVEEVIPHENNITFMDPRTVQLGCWTLTSEQEDVKNSEENFLKQRYALGIAEGDDIPMGSIVLHYNLYHLQGISLEKGCYLGQELIARTYHQGVLRKNVVPCTLEEPLEDNTPLYDKEKNQVAHIISTYGHNGIALCAKDYFSVELLTDKGSYVQMGSPFCSA